MPPTGIPLLLNRFIAVGHFGLSLSRLHLECFLFRIEIVLFLYLIQNLDAEGAYLY